MQQSKDKEEAKNAGKELVAASDKMTDAEQSTPATPSNPKPSPGQTLQVATALHAQLFYKQYFSGANSPSGAQTDGMRQLSNICTQLSTPGSDVQCWLKFQRVCVSCDTLCGSDLWPSVRF